MLGPNRAMKEADSIDRKWVKADDAEEAEPTSAASPVMWSVNVEGKDVVDMTHTELVERVRSGRLSIATFLWRDGMQDWKAVREFPEFESLVGDVKADSGLRARPEESGDAPAELDTSDTTPTHIGAMAAMRDLTNRTPPRATLEAPAEPDDGGDVPKSLEFLAVYERPVATLEFATAEASDALEPEPASDALTPNHTPSSKKAPPRPEPQKSEPPLPPLPASRKAAQSKAPPFVRKAAQPVAKTAASVVKPAAPVAKPAAPVAKAAPPVLQPAREPEALTIADVSAAPPPPSLPSTEPSDEADPLPAEVTRSEAVVPPPPASVIGPPRPAIASLPPIIVREVPASPSELFITPAAVQLDEATIVLGRRRTHRWVPLRAAILSAFGSACLASVLTWLIVRPPRVAPSAADSEAVAAAVAAAPRAETTQPNGVAAEAAQPEGAPPATPEPGAAVAAEATPAAAEGAAKTRRNDAAASQRKPSTATRDVSGLGSETPSSNEPDFRRDDPDPGLADKSATKRTADTTSPRAGWPSNPGF
jgi:hypothetical protein